MCAVEDIFSSLGEVELVEGRGLRSEQLEGVDVLLVRSVTRVDDELLADHPLRFVGSATSGIDHVDTQALARRDIPFAYAPGANADSVVDYVISAIANCSDMLEQLLAGAEVGIVGYGHVGRRLGERLQALHIRSRICDPLLEGAGLPELNSLEDVLTCPVVCLHAELTRSPPWPSYHLVDASCLPLLRDGALLINAGRGELIDTSDLIAWLRGAPTVELVLDVWEGEPRINTRLLARCRYGTPHIAGYSYDGKLRATHMLYLALCKSLGAAAFKRQAPIEPLPVSVPSHLEGAALLRWLMAKVYDIRDDDLRMRGAMPDGFDELRRNYPRRRELGSVQVSNAGQLSEHALEMCRALGCRGV